MLHTRSRFKIHFFLLLSIILFINCKKNNNEIYKIKSKNEFISSNYSNEINSITNKSNFSANDFYLDQDFLNELLNSIQTNTNYDFDLNILDDIKKYSNLETNEQKYKAILNILKKLPVPSSLEFDSEYRLNYDKFFNYYKKINQITSKILPKNIHFIWLGGKLGDIQMNYISLWAKLNSDYNVYIWHDSNNLNNYKINKKMKEYLKILLSDKRNHNNYSEIFANEMIIIQNKLNNYIINENNKSPKLTNNEIRIEFLKEFLSNKNINYKNELIELYPENNNFINSAEYLTINYKNVILKDINEEKKNWTLKEHYNQELNLRFNFAAASDNARLEILKKYGGIYIDIDVLPSINKLNNLASTEDIYLKYLLKINKEQISYAYYESIFNEHLNILPSRKVSYENIYSLNSLLPLNEYKSLYEKIKNHFDSFKNENKLENIFTRLGDIYLRPLDLKTSTRNNNVIFSHSGENNQSIINNLVEQVDSNYNKLNQYEINNPNFHYSKKSKNSDILDFENSNFNNLFNKSIQNYRYDSLIPESQSTLFISGPWAYENVFRKSGLYHKELSFLTQYDDFNDLFNTNTEEDKKSSWLIEDFENFEFENIILQLSNNQNTENAIKYFTKSVRMNKEKFSIISPQNNNYLDINSNKKVNLFIIGSSSKLENEVFIDNKSAIEIAEYIVKTFPKNIHFEFIDVMSCNPTNNSNDTDHIQNFGKKILNHINNNSIESNLIILRNNFIKLNENGIEISPKKFGLYYNTSDDNKIYLIRKSDNEYIILNNNIIKKNVDLNLSNFYKILKNISSSKTKHLSNFINSLDIYKYFYRREIEENRLIKLENFKNKEISDLSNDILINEKRILNSKLSENDFNNFYNLLNRIDRYNIKNHEKSFDYYFKLLSFSNFLNDKYNLENNKYFNFLRKTISDNFEFIKRDYETYIRLKLEKTSKSFEELKLNNYEKPILSTFDQENKKIEIYDEQSKRYFSKSLQFISQENLDNINDFKNMLDNNARKFFHSNSIFDSQLHISNPSFGLSHVYLLKNIIEYFSKKNNELIFNSNNSLDEIVKIHIYLNLSQISLDVIDNSLKISQVIRLLNSNEFKNLNSLQTFSKFTSILGSVLNIANVIFDATEYSYASTEAQKAKYGTQLVLDSSSLTLMSSGMILGESALFFSSIGEIFGGLAVGTASYAEIVGDKIDQTLKLAKYFKDYENDHYKLINTDNYFINSDRKILTFSHKDFKITNDKVERNQLNVVIEELNLTEENYYKIIFGDHITYPISRHENGQYFYHAFAPNPSLIKNSSFKVNFREALKIPKESKRNLEKVTKIILPNQVKNLIEYYFMNVPFILTRNDSDFSAVDKIQGNSKFIFRYTSLPGLGDQAVGQLKYFPQETNIKIKLSEKSQNIHLITPEIHDVAKNLLNYQIYIEKTNIANSANFHFFINEKANYFFHNNRNDSIHVHIDSIFDKYELIDENKFKILAKKNPISYYMIKFNKQLPKKIFIHDVTGNTYLVLLLQRGSVANN